MSRASAPRRPSGARPAATRGARAAAGRPAGAAPGRGRTSATRPASSSGRSAEPAARSRADRGSRRLVISTADGDRPLLSLRALALVLTMLVAFAIVAPTARHALQQAEQLRSTEEALAAAQEEERLLQEDLALWDDPAYVQAQARDRLGYVLPGQRPYVVVDPETVTGGLSAEELAEEEREAALTASRPWYLNLQDSVDLAGAVPGPDELDEIADGGVTGGTEEE